MGNKEEVKLIEDKKYRSEFYEAILKAIARSFDIPEYWLRNRIDKFNFDK